MLLTARPRKTPKFLEVSEILGGSFKGSIRVPLRGSFKGWIGGLGFRVLGSGRLLDGFCTASLEVEQGVPQGSRIRCLRELLEGSRSGWGFYGFCGQGLGFKCCPLDLSGPQWRRNRSVKEFH